VLDACGKNIDIAALKDGAGRLGQQVGQPSCATTTQKGRDADANSVDGEDDVDRDTESAR